MPRKHARPQAKARLAKLRARIDEEKASNLRRSGVPSKGVILAASTTAAALALIACS